MGDDVAENSKTVPKGLLGIEVVPGDLDDDTPLCNATGCSSFAQSIGEAFAHFSHDFERDH